MQILKNHLPQLCYSTRDIEKVSGAVVHFISAKNILPDDPFNLGAILNIFVKYKVSAHYLIERDGSVIELVPLPKRAFHAGKSIMHGRAGCNNFTVGIEVVGGIGFDYTDEQVASLTHLLAELMTEYKFTYDWIEGHDIVRAAWNKRNPKKSASIKVDPGPHFPWLDLKAALLPVSEGLSHGT